jgi:polyisoprenoid-binding protein YceI
LSTVDASPVTFDVLPGRSAVLVKARSNVGPISFATTDIEGTFSGVVEDGHIATDGVVTGHLTVSLQGLTSGNVLFDSELRRRIDTRRFPSAILELQGATLSVDRSRYELTSTLEMHDVTRAISGSVSVEISGQDTAVVRGEQTLDVRDFDLEVPTTLALKIYPDVLIELHLEGKAR